MLKSVLNFHVFLSYIIINKNEKKPFNFKEKNPPFLNQLTGSPTKNVKSFI